MAFPDVVVVGGGVIGCAIARALARGGARVTLVERERPGGQASWAAAGMLSPLAEADRPDPFLRLLLQSRALFPDFVAVLAEETGVDVGYRDEGTLLLALTEADEERMRERFRWQSEQGLAVERLTADELRDLEPAISPTVRWGLRFPEDHQVENRLLSRALWAAAEGAGVEFRLGAEVTSIRSSGGRAAGVVLLGGDRLDADAVVVAAGSWAGRLGGLPGPLPVEPVHGQLVALERLPLPFRHVVDSPRGYLVPRSDGRLIVGATVERTGFRKQVTPSGMMQILGAALEIAPSLGDAPIVEFWSGLRPGTPDGYPILGPDPRLPGLYVATGHYRNGILLTPITATLISEIILDGATGIDLSPFRPDRY